jgi:hypothetical protein
MDMARANSFRTGTAPAGQGSAPQSAMRLLTHADIAESAFIAAWERSYRESDARIFNAILRRRGFAPTAPGRWPQQNYGKAYAFRLMRKLGLTGA